MWREYGTDGYLVYSFAEVVAAMKPYYLIRVFGGLLYLTGALIMVWNVAMTIAGRLREEAPMTTAAFDPAKDRPIALPAAAE
jgi:cytochrome c oxidase cbb3-type subunit 1